MCKAASGFPRVLFVSGSEKSAGNGNEHPRQLRLDTMFLSLVSSLLPQIGRDWKDRNDIGMDKEKGCQRALNIKIPTISWACKIGP